MGWLKSIAACACAMVTVVVIALVGAITFGAPNGAGAAGDNRPAMVKAGAPAVNDRPITVQRNARGNARGGNTFAAIAVNPAHGAHGFGFGFSSRTGAQNRALQECENFSPTVPERCRIVVHVRNGCAAAARARRSDGSLSQITFAFRRSCNGAQIAALSAATRPSRIVNAVHSDFGAVR